MRKLGDRLIVAVNTNNSVKRLKGESRPINDLAARMAVLAGLASVDWVVPFDEDTPQRLIAEMLPDLLVKGGDYKPEDIAGSQEVWANGGDVRVLNFENGCSTTNVIKKFNRYSLVMKKIIIDTEQFQRIISRISHQIIEKHGDLQDVVIVGIKRRGAEIAELIQKRIKELSQIQLPNMALDITFYRDDLDLIYQDPVFTGAENQLNLNGKKVILVDDVLFTGRTIRAALDALLDFGRADRIELVILVDRGHRELPIRADYVGKNIPTAKNEQIQVYTSYYDGINQVVLVPVAHKE